jgi:Ca2+:H+ antiporter
MNKKMLFVLLPVLAVCLLALGSLVTLSTPMLALAVVGIACAVVAAVHHAEIIAHRVGEPYGTLVLALAITVIEVALVLSVMLAGGDNAATVARDTVHAAVMIICTGVIGSCLLVGGLRHGEQSFRVEGMAAGLAALAVLAVLVLVMPGFTVSSPGLEYSVPQLLFVAVASLTLWLAFVFIQTLRHRDYFLPVIAPEDETQHAEPPSAGAAWASVCLLLAALVGVVGLAKLISPALDRTLAAAGLPKAVLGILIATIVLLPETWAAIRAARVNRLQTSMNLAIGSALASIGLTVPVVVGAALILGLPITLGLPPKDIVLLGLAMLVGAISLGSGRTNMMLGVVHLIVFAAFLVLAVVP